MGSRPRGLKLAEVQYVQPIRASSRPLGLLQLFFAETVKGPATVPERVTFPYVLSAWYAATESEAVKTTLFMVEREQVGGSADHRSESTSTFRLPSTAMEAGVPQSMRGTPNATTRATLTIAMTVPTVKKCAAEHREHISSPLFPPAARNPARSVLRTEGAFICLSVSGLQSRPWP